MIRPDRRLSELRRLGSRLGRSLHRRFHPLLLGLLPTDCFACGEPLGRFQQFGACAGCWADLALLEPPLCPRCGQPVPPATDEAGPAHGLCFECVSRCRACDRVRAVVAYDSLARRFILRAKLSGRPELLRPLGAQLARVLEIDGLTGDCTRVVPVPSHPWTTLSRGFSPALELARPVARRLGLGLGCVLKRRAGWPRAAKRLGARERRSAAGSAYRVCGTMRGERVLLIDDVMTTGATIDACSRALKWAGAEAVRAGVWARTPALAGQRRSSG